MIGDWSGFHSLECFLKFTYYLHLTHALSTIIGSYKIFWLERLGGYCYVVLL